MTSDSAINAVNLGAEVLTRRYLTHANDLASIWMQDSGMSVRKDAVDNIIGHYPGEISDASALIISSHLDRLVMAGKCDGFLGAITGVSMTFSRCTDRIRHNPDKSITPADADAGTRVLLDVMQSYQVRT